jgi:outer membrane protein assembly factor BamB
MSLDAAFIPGRPDATERGELAYREPSARARGLYVFMQDVSPRATAARRRFLLACFRDTIAAWHDPARVMRPAAFLRERVLAFDRAACSVDTRLDDFEELGLFVAVRENDSVYVLCARGANARVRARGGFVPLATPDIEGVWPLSIETARAQQDLFAQTFPETLALYRIAAEGEAHGTRELLLGGAAPDIAVVADLLAQPGVAVAGDVRVERMANTVLMLTLDARPEGAGELPAGERMHRGFARKPPRSARWGAAAVVVVAAGVAGFAAWRTTPESRRPREAVTALRETPAPPREKRVLEPVAVEPSRSEPARPEEKKEAPRFDVAWQQSYRAAVTSSPVVAGDAVVFGGRDGRVYSVHRESGRTQWTYSAQGGVGASPLFRGGSILAADYAGNVVRLRAGDGRVVWKRALREKIVSTPASSDERVLVGTMTGRVYALSLETGRVLWKWSARGPVRGSIAFAEGTFVVPSHDGRLYALVEETGARRWVLALGAPVASSPATDGDIVVVGSARGEVVAVDLRTGKRRWTYRAGGAVNSSLALVDGRVYAGAGDRRLHCIDAASGEPVWRFDTEGAVLARPFVSDGRVVLTSYDRRVYCLDAATGALIGRYETDESIYSSPVVAEGRVFFGNNAGRFYCLHTPGS